MNGRYPLWEPGGIAGQVKGVSADSRQVLVTTVMDALPDHRPTLPSPSIWPFLGAVATSAMFIGSIFTPWAVVWGAIPIAIALTLWFWPSRAESERSAALEVQP
jgi:hypothetical protein